MAEYQPLEVFIDRNAPAIDAVINRDPCPECGETSFGAVASDDPWGMPVHTVAEYHAPACPRVADGAVIIATVPMTPNGIDIAKRYLLGEDDTSA